MTQAVAEATGPGVGPPTYLRVMGYVALAAVALAILFLEEELFRLLLLDGVQSTILAAATFFAALGFAAWWRRWRRPA